MIDFLIIAVLILVWYPLMKDDNKYKEIDRQRAMRRAMSRLQEKYRRFSL